MSKIEKYDQYAWSELMADWRQDEKPIGINQTQEERLDTFVQAMISKVKRERARSKVSTAVNVIMATLSGAYIANEIRLGLPSQFDYALYSLMLLLIVIFSFSVTWYQGAHWKARTESSGDYAQLMLDQNISASKIAKATTWFGYSILFIFYGVVLWAFFPSILGGTLVTDLSNIAKPILGSIILGSVTLAGLATIYSGQKQQRSLKQKIENLRNLVKEFQ